MLMVNKLSFIQTRSRKIALMGQSNVTVEVEGESYDVQFGQSYKASTIVIYDSRVVPDL